MVNSEKEIELSSSRVVEPENILAFFSDYVVPFSRENHVGSQGFIQRCMPLVEMYKDKPISAIDGNCIAVVFKTLNGELQETTKGRYLKAWNKFFNIAKEHGFIEINPCKVVSKPNVNQSSVRILSLVEVAALVDGALVYPNAVHSSAILFTLFTGEPLERIRSLEWAWLSDDYSSLKTAGLSDKKSINIDLNIVAQAIIRNAKNHDGTTYLFPAVDRYKRALSTPMSKPQSCFNSLRSYVQDKTGVMESFNSFDLRKTYKHYFQNADNTLLIQYQELVLSDRQ